MPVIKVLKGLEILDSRGRPTVGATCGLQGGATAWASVPSGASTGRAEAVELRDGERSRYGGLGCRWAVRHINAEVFDALKGREISSQKELDQLLIDLDGTPDKSRLGANALLAVSIAFARACAMEGGVPLHQHFAGMIRPDPPTATEIKADAREIKGDARIYKIRASPLIQRASPLIQIGASPLISRRGNTLPRLTVNLFSGGKHAGGQVPIQDVLLAPMSATTIDQSLAMVYAVYQAAAALCDRKYQMRTLVADEGGLAPPFPSIDAMLGDAVESIRDAGFEPGRDVALAVDVASSHFYSGNKYDLGGTPLDSAQMIELIARWIERYPIISVEDGLAEEDWENWPVLRTAIGSRAMVLGDDLLCTNPTRIRRAIDTSAANALLLKVNQIGTLSEAAEAFRLARSAGWAVTVSARSGETEDDWLADVAVGWGGDQIKVGSITRSERLAKYNRLLAIEAQTGWPIAAWPNVL